MSNHHQIYTNFPIQLRTWVHSQLPLVTVVQNPFNQTDWPLPAPAAQIDRSWVNQRTPANIPPPVRPTNTQYDWPLPTQPFRQDQTWIRYRIPPPTIPFNQYSWPLPPGQVPPRPDSTWIEFGNNFPPLLNVQKPFNQTDWPVPTPQPYPAWLYTWTDGPPTPGSIPPPVMGKNQYNWPLPIPPFRPDFTWAEAGNNFPPLLTQSPFNQYNWPLPTPNPRPDAFYSFFNILLEKPTVTILPFNQYDWPLPVPPFRIDQGYILEVPLLTPVPPPPIIPQGGGKYHSQWLKDYEKLKREQRTDIKEAAAVLSRAGGLARAKALSPKQRSAIASLAAKTRWK